MVLMFSNGEQKHQPLIIHGVFFQPVTVITTFIHRLTIK